MLAPETERYTRENIIGKGSFGKIWKAKDNKTGKEVAIKEIKVSGGNLTVLKKELDILKTLSIPECFPSLVCYYDYYVETVPLTGNKYLYLVMEYIKGEDLMTFIDRIWGRDDDDDTNVKKKTDAEICDLLISIIKDVCEGLLHMNKHGLIHRDMKPENILITDNYQPKIVDFGLSCKTYNQVQKDDIKWLEKTDTQVHEVKETVEMEKTKNVIYCSAEPFNDKNKDVLSPCCRGYAGSPLYMPPETYIHEKSLYVSDIWSLGATIYDVYTDGKYFEGIQTRKELDDKLRNSNFKADPLNSSNEFLNDLIKGMFIVDTTERLTATQIIYMISEYLKNKKSKFENTEISKNR